MYENRQFAIFSTLEISKVDFNEVLETSAETARKSVDGTLTLVKWDGQDIPSSLVELTTIQGYYNYEEILELMSSVLWTSPMDYGI